MKRSHKVLGVIPPWIGHEWIRKATPSTFLDLLWSVTISASVWSVSVRSLWIYSVKSGVDRENYIFIGNTDDPNKQVWNPLIRKAFNLNNILPETPLPNYLPPKPTGKTHHHQTSLFASHLLPICLRNWVKKRRGDKCFSILVHLCRGGKFSFSTSGIPLPSKSSPVVTVTCLCY